MSDQLLPVTDALGVEVVFLKADSLDSEAA
jgi:hypothetical protein